MLSWATCVVGQSSVSMKEYVDLQAQLAKERTDLNHVWSARYNDAQLAAIKEANELVRLALEEYKTVNNEWRGQMRDMQEDYITKQTFFSVIGAMGVIFGLFIGYMNFIKQKNEKTRAGHSGDVIAKT